MKSSILIVDDEPTQLHLVERTVTHKLNYHAVTAPSGQAAVDILLSDSTPVDLVLLDLEMPGMNGMEVIHTIRRAGLSLPIIVLTAHSGLENAVTAIRAGADDFISKPANPERLGISIQNILRMNTLSSEVNRLKRSTEGLVVFDDLIGASQAFKSTVTLGQRAANSNIPILIEGESGVGKEMFARAIHGSGERAGKPFLAVNCGAIPDNLVESILFGHEKGAFTGASARTLGKFREANGGTLFLDEIGELKLDLQVKLLRALQQGEVEPVGGRGSVKVDVRIISATNRNLSELVARGEFREDLFYRLNVFPIHIPSLRQRKEDIKSLAQHFLRRFASMENKTITGFAPDALAEMEAAAWHGNIRELENAVFRATVLCDGGMLTAQHFHHAIFSSQSGSSDYHKNRDARPPVGNGNGAIPVLDAAGHVRKMIDMEAELIRFALNYYKGHMSEVARRLGIGRSTLYRKINDLDIVAFPERRSTDGSPLPTGEPGTRSAMQA